MYNCTMNVRIHESWKTHLQEEFEKEYFRTLAEFVKNEYLNKTVYPPPEAVFRAFDTCPFDRAKVVILGQDPYHGINQANGLCFAVNDGIQLPPSLQNIFKELNSDLNIQIPKSGNLQRWADQGVLLLNSVLTVEKDQAASHQKKGWEIFTDKIIEVINENCDHVVFILWGAYAQKKAAFVDRKKHLVLESVHPSPLSSHRGFFGSKPFSKANDWLQKKQIKPINW